MIMWMILFNSRISLFFFKGCEQFPDCLCLTVVSLKIYLEPQKKKNKQCCKVKSHTLELDLIKMIVKCVSYLRKTLHSQS